VCHRGRGRRSGHRRSRTRSSHRRGRRSAGSRRRANDTSRTGRESAGSTRCRGDPIRRGILPGYYRSSDPIACRIRLPLVGVFLLINLLPPAITITSCVVHFVNDILVKLINTSCVLRIRGIGQAVLTPFGLQTTRRCINHLS
jgi:hypothetical protein